MSYLTDVLAIRDALVTELKMEMTRRAALVAAGNPPPVSYSLDGKSVSWNEYLSLMTGKIREFNQMVISAGADGGIIDEWVRGYC